MNFAPGKILSEGNSPRKCICSVPAQEMAKHRAVGSASGKQRRCSNEGKTRNPLKFAMVSQTPEPISSLSGPKFAMLWRHVEDILLFNKLFFRLSIHILVAKIQPDKLCDGVQMAIFVSCISSEPRAAHFRPAF